MCVVLVVPLTVSKYAPNISYLIFLFWQTSRNKTTTRTAVNGGYVCGFLGGHLLLHLNKHFIYLVAFVFPSFRTNKRYD